MKKRSQISQIDESIYQKNETQQKNETRAEKVYLPIIRADAEHAAELKKRLSTRDKMQSTEVNAIVSKILDETRRDGVAALLAYTERFDGVTLEEDEIEVSRAEIVAAKEELDPALLDSLKGAAERIRTFHERQMEQEHDLEMDDGAGRRLALLRRPLEKVGLYVPGGTAALPSSVLMNAIPAKVAGVSELLMCTPPSDDKTIDALILTAVELSGVDRVFRMGGAQAIAALAYGVGPVPAVDKICGPGNIYVNTAKRLVYGQVDIDMFAGPSEILIIADAEADPRFVARDLLSQAEHDKLASAVLLTDSAALARAVQTEIGDLVPNCIRLEQVEASLRDFGAVLLVEDLDEAIRWANQIAPEHLELCMAPDKARQLLPLIRHAGAVFIGPFSPEPLGDYWAGANHVLPTSGTARFFSPLNCGDFIKKMSVIEYSEAALRQDGRQIIRLAEAEKLDCHAEALRIRLREEEKC